MKRIAFLWLGFFITIRGNGQIPHTNDSLNLMKQDIDTTFSRLYASMAAFAPIPVKNMYSATKSAVIFFSYALHFQLKDKDISVSCRAPGQVYTKPEIEAELRNNWGYLATKWPAHQTRLEKKQYAKP